jgi:hypothetical protein
MKPAAEQAVLLFHTSSHAIRAEKVLTRAGIDCRLTPVPRHLSSDCGVCLRLDRAGIDAAREILARARVEVAAGHTL